MNYINERLLFILTGIDETETESDNGWWETSAGAEFGSRKLKEVIMLLEQAERDVYLVGKDKN